MSRIYEYVLTTQTVYVYGDSWEFQPNNKLLKYKIMES